ncbi:MAG: polysaccharide biosynthesis tyrosine autokinase [Planctomycetota bacterium]
MVDTSNEEEGGGIALLEILELVRRRWILHGVCAIVGAALAIGWVATKDPVYRAQATLLLDQEGATSGILSDLAALTQAPVAISEMEVLRSRTVAEEVVAAPVSGVPSLADVAPDGADLGLTALVDDTSLRPLARIGGRLFGGASGPKGAASLEAAATLPAGEPGPICLEITFETSSRVAISTLGMFGAGARETVDIAPGEPFEYGGSTIALRPTADVAGKTYVLTVLSDADAVERVMESTRVQETDRNSGVIQITYGDTDPLRAAATVNALCRNYLVRNKGRSERRASHTVSFIDDQLQQQIEALEAAEAQVVELKTESPTSVDVTEAARVLIEELSALEVRRVEGQLVKAGLEEAVELIRAGDVSALSRLTTEVPDPIVLGYVESIVRLNAEAELLDRPDTGPFKALLQGHLLELRAERDAVAMKLATLRRVETALRDGDLSVLGQLETVANAGTSDTMLTALVEQWTEIDGRLRALRTDFNDTLPEIQSLLGQQEALVEGLTELIGGRVAGLDAQLSEYDALQQGRDGDIDSLPGAERERIEAAVDRLRGRALEHLDARLAGLVTSDRLIGEQAEALHARIAELPESEKTLAGPMRAVVTHGEIVKLLLMRQQEAEITRAASLASAEFIDAAIPPRRPSGPSVPVHLVMGFLLGLGAALGFSLLRASKASAVVTSSELETASGLPTVGSIPNFKRGRTKVKHAGEDFVALRDDAEGPIAEAYRALRSNLKFIIRSKGSGTTLAITSSGPGEGKSVTNIDVALSFAMAGKRVLLVDADMRRASASTYLKIPQSPGLSEVLQGRATWQGSVVAACHESLHVLPSGTVPASPGDLLASPGTAEMIGEMRAAYDLVVLDVPPVLAVADIECIATHIDTALLLCRSARTTDAVVRHAVTRLRQVGANVVGTVLNGVAANRGVGGYGYGYGYGYGQDTSSKDTAA